MRVVLFDTHTYDRESFTASNQVLQDDVLARLLTFPNVLVTSHQAFLTKEALANIASTTLSNITAVERGEHLINEVRVDEVLLR